MQDQTYNEILIDLKKLEIENTQLREQIENLNKTLVALAPYEKDSYDYETEIAELKTAIIVLARMVR